MSKRETLGNISPTGNGRSNMGGLGRMQAGAGKDGMAQGAARAAVLPMKQGRPSMAPAALLDRRSSAFGKSAGLKTDPRPLGDKTFLNGCIRTVITYLSTHGYPYAVSPKVLTSPTGKDFTQIAQFLFQRFDPTMKAFAKVEDEVPLFFKRLNYPFAISKSALFAVGSPHSWPSVLAALTWLVELLNYEEKAAQLLASDAAGGPGALDTDRQRSERQFYDYVAASYRFFLAGDDASCATKDEEMLGQVRAREDALAAEVERLQQARDATAREVEALRAAPSPLAAAAAARDECARDKEKFVAALDNMAAAKATCARKVEERKAELAARKQQLADVAGDNERLKQTVANQALSRADVNRLLAERAKLKGVLDAATAAREDLERAAEERGAEAGAAAKALEEAVRQYNLAAHKLALIPASAKRANGISFELAVPRDEDAPAGVVGADIKGVIKPGLVALRERYRGKARDLAEDGLGLAEQLDAAREAARERAEDVASAQLAAQKLEGTYRALRDEVDGDVRATGEQADRIKDEVASLRNAAAGQLSDAEERLRAAAADYDALQRRCQAELEALRRGAHAAMDAMMTHRLEVRQVMEDVRNAAAEAARAVAAAQVPEPACAAAGGSSG